MIPRPKCAALVPVGWRGTLVPCGVPRESHGSRAHAFVEVLPAIAPEDHIDLPAIRDPRIARRLVAIRDGLL